MSPQADAAGRPLDPVVTLREVVVPTVVEASGLATFTWPYPCTARVRWDTGEEQAQALAAAEPLELASVVPCRATVWADEVAWYSAPVEVDVAPAE